MSELKEWTASEIEEYDDARLELAQDGNIDCTRVYIKSEADKVIADLEQKLAAAQQVLRLNEPKALYSNLETMGRLKHKIDIVARRERHHKYKRCLAMAEWCDAEADVADADGDYEDMRWYQKWHNRWLAIAEKSKEAK